MARMNIIHSRHGPVHIAWIDIINTRHWPTSVTPINIIWSGHWPVCMVRIYITLLLFIITGLLTPYATWPAHINQVQSPFQPTCFNSLQYYTSQDHWPHVVRQIVKLGIRYGMGKVHWMVWIHCFKSTDISAGITRIGHAQMDSKSVTKCHIVAWS